MDFEGEMGGCDVALSGIGLGVEILPEGEQNSIFWRV